MSLIRLSAICLFGLGASLYAQDSPAPAAQTPPPAAPAPPTWSVGPIDFSGLVDGYYDLNFNHPNPAANGNQLYNFDVHANQFSLNMAKLSLSHTADPIGFQVDFGFGRAFEIVHGTDASATEHIEQAFVSFKPPKGHGFQVDFGQFVTSAGAEVIETNSNWNYSRSLLFAWAIPYYHFGVRVTQPLGSHFTGGFQVVNGWNNMQDNNTGKNIGIIGNVNTKKFTWSNNYYTGPENPGSNKGFRNLYDTTLLLTPADKFNAYINFDYGRNKSYTGNIGSTAEWYGIAAAAKFQMNGKNAFTPRIEWFKDKDGFETGTAQELKEFTLTYEYKWVEGLLTRLEYRRDWSDQKFFQRGVTPGASDHQDTLAIAFVAFFGPKR
jgi:putative OmpL-like beta-barrel porin-2